MIVNIDTITVPMLFSIIQRIDKSLVFVRIHLYGIAVYCFLYFHTLNVLD